MSERAIELRDPMIVEIERVQKELMRFRDTAHILSPMARTDWDSIMPGYRISIRIAQISADPKDQEVYEPPENPGKFSLTKIGLQKLDRLAGLQWEDSKVFYNPAEPFVARGRAEARIQDMDGSWRGAIGNRIVDLRDGAPEAQKMVDVWHKQLKRENKPIPKDGIPPQLSRARMYAVQNAESKAKNRVRRELLGLQQSFTKEELARPFCILKLVPKIDLTDPLVRQLLTMQQLGISADLYQQAVRSLQPPAQEEQHAPVVLTPGDTTDLDIDPPPGEVVETNVVVEDTPAEKIEEEKEKLRAEQIQKITELYKRKGIKRDPKKPPLTSLDDDQLDQIQSFLESKPDAKTLV